MIINKPTIKNSDLLLKNLLTEMLIIGCLLFSFNLLADDKIRLSVYYPDGSKRSEVLYQTILKSMKSDQSMDIIVHQFSKNSNPALIEQQIKKDQSNALILLGTAGVNLAKKLSVNIPTITGAHMLMQHQQSGVSLAADPIQLFTQLKAIEPNIKTIKVIYSPENNGWLIEQAKAAAKLNDLKIDVFESSTIQSSGIALKDIMKNIEPKTEAIWLPYDPIMPVKQLLPDLLQKAWNKNIIVFSGNPYHVQQGTLFALFPDYSKLGKQLLELCQQRLNQKQIAMTQPSKYLNRAINIRTASHLGINLTNREKENYQMVFPKN